MTCRPVIFPSWQYWAVSISIDLRFSSFYHSSWISPEIVLVCRLSVIQVKEKYIYICIMHIYRYVYIDVCIQYLLEDSVLVVREMMQSVSRRKVKRCAQCTYHSAHKFSRFCFQETIAHCAIVPWKKNPLHLEREMSTCRGLDFNSFSQCPSGMCLAVVRWKLNLWSQASNVVSNLKTTKREGRGRRMDRRRTTELLSHFNIVLKWSYSCRRRQEGREGEGRVIFYSSGRDRGWRWSGQDQCMKRLVSAHYVTHFIK